MKECNILNVLDIKSNAESLLDMYKRVLRNPSNVTIDKLHLFKNAEFYVPGHFQLTAQSLTLKWNTK